MMAFWHKLEKREQRALLLGGTVLACFLLFQFLFLPLRAYRESLAQQIQQNQSLIPWMQRAEAQLKSQAPVPQKAIDKSDLLSSLSVALQSSDFKSFRYTLRQTATGAELRFERVPFAPLIRWLSTLQTQNQIRLLQLDAKASDESGVVQLSMRLAV